MAAAVFIPPSPHNSFPSMAASTRRQPLMSIQNAANSPHRMLTLSGSKRTRAVANVSQQENEPPAKKQAVEKSLREPVPVTPQRRRQHDPNEGQVFEDDDGAEVTTFQKKLAAARDRNASKTTRGIREAHRQETETIRQWQKHYRKLFPHFRFYFDSVPADIKKVLLKQAMPLGAQEETFFSNKVTHIITGRPIPSDEAVSKALESAEGTINPSVLEVKTNGKATARRDVVSANDIMIRGMQMKMKVWPSEKLQKILNALVDGQSVQEQTSRTTKSARANNDLVQVLKNERMAATAEHQATMPRELVQFRGPFIYVHDMDEKVKPIMVREYPKVARRQDGEWPQFRSASIGKCPFVEDVAAKRDIDREAARQYKVQLIQQQREAEKAAAQSKMDITSQTIAEPMKMDPPRRTSPRKVLRDVPNTNAASVQQIVSEKPPPPERQSSFPPMPEQPPVDFVKPSQMLLVREPSASGIQRSAMTSAIQSQMISSAAATGLKATTSKEVHELKRKVLERTHTGSLSIGSISSSHQANALTGALKTSRAPTHRAAKSKAQEKLGGIQEEADPYADDLAAERASHGVLKKKKPAKREPKPGYCENCHDKYEDFEDHIISRKHRKFAMTASNWTELDALLEKLQDS